jgi:membrane-bound lytic murein transglycosylase
MNISITVFLQKQIKLKRIPQESVQFPNKYEQIRKRKVGQKEVHKQMVVINPNLTQRERERERERIKFDPYFIPFIKINYM